LLIPQHCVNCYHSWMPILAIIEAVWLFTTWRRQTS
jgi:hypothetical protein